MKLKEIRESKAISQRQAALALNLSPTVYNRYENGLREPPNIILLSMADYFGVTVDAILGRDEEKKEAPASGLDDRLVDMLVSLSPDQVQRVMDFVAGMKASEKA